MLAAHEARAADAEGCLQGKRQQGQRPTAAITGDHEEWRQPRALTDVTLPGGEEVETLIGRDGMFRALKTAPDRLGRIEVADGIDGGDATWLRPSTGRRFTRP